LSHDFVFKNRARQMPERDKFVTMKDGDIRVGVVMGSASDWATMKDASIILRDLGIRHECRVVSAHRMPEEMADYGRTALSRGLRAIIAGAGGAAHLPGMLAAHTRVPVLGVPVQSHALHGMDSLLSIAQMPAGIPVATFAIGPAGAKNAALFAAAILAEGDASVAAALDAFRAEQTAAAAEAQLPSP
jgi:5-(carboxyamino)imidazole ribonucleotide mutase